MGAAEALTPAGVYGVLRRYFPVLWRDPERRDDAAAEGWIAAEEARASWDAARGGHFGAYAVQRIRFRLLDWLRAERGGRGKRRPVLVALPRDLRYDAGEDRILARIDAERAWARWGERERDVAWSLASGYTAREVAARWGVTEQAVSQVRGRMRRRGVR